MDNNIQRKSENDILTEHQLLVKRIALKTVAKLPPNILIDDLMQVGMMALLQAAKNYDPTKGASFTTYAGIRIRGAMIDEIRREDWLPRSTYRNAKILDKINNYIANNTDDLDKSESFNKSNPSKKITIDEICKHLNISHEEYSKIDNNKSNYKIYHFDDIGINEDSIMIQNSNDKDIYSKVANKQLRNSIDENIKKLSDRERIVLILYYENDLNLKQIGDVLSLTESRVCQIHSQAMVNLGKHMSGWL